MNQVTIRQLSQEDIESLHACLDSVARERKYLGFTQVAPIEETRKSLVDDMQRGVIRLIALDESNVVGWCHIRPDRWEGFTHAGWLGMGVLKGYRSQGIGSALLYQSLGEARSRGLERVELSVFASNLTAIHLYEKFKFEIEGRKKRARKLDGIYDDIIIMGLIFEQASS
jgi:ribosomal protein S18 acetylase RimI-like enzyme